MNPVVFVYPETGQLIVGAPLFFANDLESEPFGWWLIVKEGDFDPSYMCSNDFVKKHLESLGEL